MIRYRIDVLAYLKNCGYTQGRIQKEHILSSSTLDRFSKDDTNISMKTLNTLCQLTDLSVEDIIEYVPD